MFAVIKPARLLSAMVLVVSMAACGTVDGPANGALPLSDEPLLGKFVWHDLITDDVDGAKRFYAGLLGWEFEDTQRPNGGSYTLIKSGGYYVGGILALADPAGGEYSRWLGYLSVADVDAAAAAARRAGGAVVAAPRDIGDIARAAAITDPQGAVVGLLRTRFGDPRDHYRDRPGHVAWNELLAADGRAAGEFYASLAGLDAAVVARRGGEYILLRQGGLERAGILQRPDDALEPLWLTYFAVEDPAVAAGEVESLGGEVLLAPSPELREGSMAVITDPGGAVLALQRRNAWKGTDDE